MKSEILAMLALAGCGDNDLPNATPLVAARDLAIVAHQDDDLLFMQPDLLEAVWHGTGVTIVYVTAGNDDHGVDYSTKRDTGIMAAYSAASGANGAWACGWLELAGHAAEHCRLDAASLSLVFLGYPDGGKQGQFPGSLLELWEGEISGADTIAAHTAHYDRDGLIATLAEVIATTQPRTIRTLEVAATHGSDHSDHMLVGALAVLARARAGADIELLAYRGYDTDGEPANGLAPISTLADVAFAHYQACADGCAAGGSARCGDTCPTISVSYAAWIQRRYAVGVGRYASGALVANGACADADASGNLAMTDCAAAATWRFDRDGMLHVGDRCIAMQPSGALVAGACDAATPIAFDVEGHAWIGVAPAPQAAMDLAHLDCIAVVNGQPRAALCGAALAPAWTIAPPTIATLRSTIGLAQTGRAVRLADLTGDGKADLCAVEATGLLCAAGDGAGSFASAVRIDDPSAPLAIEPESLAIGDVDGDGKLDACGRDSGGISCATSTTGFAAQRFTSAFGHDGPGDASDRSLAVIAGEICGLSPDGAGVICAARDAPAQLRSPWPASDAVLWAADLDGDQLADWCVATATGPACGLAADRALSMDGVPWAFSLGGVIDDSPADTNTGGLGDIDGDGRADLCALDGTTMTCAFSQGGGFGPRTTVMQLPEGVAPIALWLGDLDGDGKADACVDTGAAVICAI